MWTEVEKMIKNRKGVTCRELVEYQHSYYCFLEKNLPEYLPPPSNVPPPPPIPRPTKMSINSKEVDLRILNLDPREWKKQDHYLLLGLQDKRHNATQSEIRTAYRKSVLLYHPDKLQQSSSHTAKEGSIEDNIFKCLHHAYQLLSDPEKRKQYDSVDSNSFDESIPTEDIYTADEIEKFIQVYRPVFIRNARFSKKLPVPDIGHAFSPREEVETFYAFWSTFESWRTFDYFDEDENENPENRADKRWVEKKNKAARTKRKNDDNARLRRLFEQAYKVDPRVVRFKDDDRLRKEAVRMEKGMAALRITQEREQARLEKETREREERERIAQAEAIIKQERDAIMAKIRRDKKAIKKILYDNLYFVSDPTNVPLINQRSILVEKVMVTITDLEPILAELERRVNCGQKDEIMDWLATEYETAKSRESTTPAPKPVVKSEAPESPPPEAPWSHPEVETLINAIKNHPGGLRERWTRITEWYNRVISHLDKGLPIRTTDELLKRANDIKHIAEDGQAAVSNEAQSDYRAFQKKRDPRIDQATPTIVIDANVWDAEQQKRLEQGLKLIKADDPERWDKIAQFVGRPKKDCMLRAKEIAMILKQKKTSTAS
jgi:DnaJ family protein C protein 2